MCNLSLRTKSRASRLKNLRKDTTRPLRPQSKWVKKFTKNLSNLPTLPSRCPSNTQFCIKKTNKLKCFPRPNCTRNYQRWCMVMLWRCETRANSSRPIPAAAWNTTSKSSTHWLNCIISDRSRMSSTLLQKHLCWVRKKACSRKGTWPSGSMMDHSKSLSADLTSFWKIKI